MGNRQDRHQFVLANNKPSTSFASISSAASATSAASSRSGGSKLLFGEIDTNSDRSSENYASVCSFVLCDSSTFLKFWLDDKCRDKFLSYVPRTDLASLRLACHDFSVRAAPALFSDLKITFRTSTFTKPAKLAALDRLGFYVKTLKFSLPHTRDTFLPPLVDPETGAELSYTYTPQLTAPSLRRPKYGDAGTTEVLTRQYPALFHAATNVPAFIQAFSAFVNLEHLIISCPGHDTSQRQRRSIVDFALISVRVAVEQNSLNALRRLTLAPIHPGGLLYLSPVGGYGATPRSASRWSRIQHLTIRSTIPPPNTRPEHLKLLHTYLRTFQPNLTTFIFRWHGSKGPLPLRQSHSEHPAHRDHFPKLQHIDITSVACSAAEISAFAAGHKRTLREMNLEDFTLTAGTWKEALAPLTKTVARKQQREEMAEIPIMFAPETAVERDEMGVVGEATGPRLSRWLAGRRSKVRQAGPLKKVLGGVLLPSWKLCDTMIDRF